MIEQIFTTADRQAELQSLGWENNPFVLWDNKVTTANVSAPGGVAEGGNASNCATGTTYDFCAPLTAGSAASIEVATTDVISCVGIAAHNLADDLRRVFVERYVGGAWQFNELPLIAPVNNGALIWRFTPRTGEKWRVRIQDSDVAPSIGVLFFGQELIFNDRFYQGYAPPITPNMVEMVGNVSEGGNLLGTREINRGSKASASFTLLAPGQTGGPRTRDFDGFQKHYNGGGGFFWAWRPGKYDDAFYAWRDGGVMAPSNAGPKDYMSANMEMRLYDQPDADQSGYQSTGIPIGDSTGFDLTITTTANEDWRCVTSVQTNVAASTASASFLAAPAQTIYLQTKGDTARVFNVSSGDLTFSTDDLPKTLTQITTTSGINVSGDVAALPPNLQLLSQGNYGSISGDLAEFKSTLTFLNTGVSEGSLITGNVFGMGTPSLNTFIFNAAGPLTVSGTWAFTTTNMVWLIVKPRSAGLTQAEVDLLLSEADTKVTTWTGAKTVDVSGFNAAPTGGAANANVVSLQGKGVTVVINT